STKDAAPWSAGPPPGAPIPDAPFRNGHLSERLGDGFALLHWRASAAAAEALGVVDVSDEDEALIARFGLTPGAGYLIRPDRHVAARFHQMGQGALTAALSRAGAA
ncbi:MAG: hypothetical protein ACKO1I_02445, partial [Microcystis aeruginosa]